MQNNKKANEPIQLTDNLFIGKGTHRACYQHPENASLCIKVAYNDGGVIDFKREIKYRHILQRRHADTHILPAYYGTISTNMGTGYVYELIQDYDGSTSKTLEEFLQDETLVAGNFTMLVEQLKELHRQMYDNSILTMGLFPVNIIAQQISAGGKYTFRLINDMGSAVLIPLEYVFDFVAKKKVEKRWQQFLQRTHKWHREGRLPSPLVEKILQAVED